MKSRRSAVYRSVSFAVVCLSGIVLFGGGPASAQRSPEAEQACTPDVMRLCGDYIPNVQPIVACLIRNRLQLSPDCKRYIRPRPALRR